MVPQGRLLLPAGCNVHYVSWLSGVGIGYREVLDEDEPRPSQLEQKDGSARMAPSMILRQRLRGSCHIAEERIVDVLPHLPSLPQGHRAGPDGADQKGATDTEGTIENQAPRLQDTLFLRLTRFLQQQSTKGQHAHYITISARPLSQGILARRSPACRAQRARFRLCSGCRSRRGAAGLDEILAQIDAQLLEMGVLQFDLAVCTFLALWFLDIGSGSGARLGDGRCGPHTAWSGSSRD